MPYHVRVFVFSDPSRTRGRRNRWFLNVSEEHLRSRFIEPWDRGTGITYDGDTFDPMESRVEIFETDESLSPDLAADPSRANQAVGAGRNLTNELIVGPAGRLSAESVAATTESRKDRRQVMVVHGRNDAARDAMFAYLRCLGLAPIEWEQAVAETGMGSPYTLEAVQAAMDVAQAVVVVLTAEDRAGLLPELAGIRVNDTAFEGQPRPNVMLEAGMALGTGRAGIVFVQLGEIRGASDLDGLNMVRLTNAAQTRAALRQRLINAGCLVEEAAQDYLTPGGCGDFEQAVVSWTAGDAADAEGRFAAASTSPEGGSFALALRAYGFPASTRFYCSVARPNGERIEVEPQATTDAFWNARQSSTLYPANFPDAPIPAETGIHSVEWIAEIDRARRVVATDEFQPG